eukprot:scaffold99404_cov55-Phaeocystis_antarctica.AAC.2
MILHNGMQCKMHTARKVTDTGSRQVRTTGRDERIVRQNILSCCAVLMGDKELSSTGTDLRGKHVGAPKTIG